MKNIEKLEKTLLDIAKDNELYNILVEKLPSHTYCAVNNYVGGYDSDLQLIKNELNLNDFNLINRIRFNSTERSFKEYQITSESMNDYIDSVLAGDIKSENIILE